MALLKQTTAYNRAFLMVDSSDHITGKSSVTVTVTLSKNGGSFASASGSVSELANGWYYISLDSTDTNTQGELAYHCTASGADPTDFSDQVVAVNLADGTRFGMIVLPNIIPAASGGLPTVDANNAVKVQSGTGSNQINLTSGNVTLTGGTHSGAIIPVVVTAKNLTTNNDKTGYSLTAGQLFVKKNTALTGFQFPLVDFTDHVTLKSGATVTGTVSLDGGAFASLTNSVSEIGSTGIYTVDLGAADLNGINVLLRFTSGTAADVRLIRLITQT